MRTLFNGHWRNSNFMTSKVQISKKIPNWARLLVPIILGATLIAIVVQIMYFGGKRESLVAQGESAIIRWALEFASEPITQTSERIVSISLSDVDLPAVDLAQNTALVDASIGEYAAVLEQVAASNPEWIVINWLTYAHPVTQDYLKPITDVIDRLNIHKKTTIAINFYASGTIAPEFIQTYNIVEARDCYYEINSFCTVSSEWTWMPQQVINRFFINRPQWHVSLNLPHILPNILLNLPEPSSITQRTFIDFRPPVMSDIPQNAIIFIGNNATQTLHFRDNKDALQKTYVPASNPRRTLMKDGIPWHVFWASMTSMFLEQRTIAVVPAWVVWCVILLLTCAILLSIKFLGGAALAPFFICAVSLPLANILSISQFKIYMPVMPIVIAGFVVFTAATFASVAYSSYKKFRYQAKEELAESTADIKQNFIHLISHNLNTPIAQLRGLLEVLAQEQPTDNRIFTASRLLEFIRIIVRAVLNTTTMANQELQIKEQPLKSFVQGFLDHEMVFFRRTGIQLTVTPDEEDEDLGAVYFYKFMLDKEITNACVLYACVLIVLQNHAQKVNCNLRPINDEPANPQGLIVTISSGDNYNSDHLNDSNFPCQALLRFLEMTQSRGIVEFTSSTNSIQLKFINFVEKFEF